MNDIFRTVLIMSLSGSLLAVLLMAGRPLYRRKLRQSIQYYMWLIVIGVLLIPFSKLIRLPMNDQSLPIFSPLLYEMVEQNILSYDEQREFVDAMGRTEYIVGKDTQTWLPSGMGPVATLTEWMITIYPIGVAVVLLYHFMSYFLFCHRMKRSSIRTTIDFPLPVYRSKLAKTPMLMGIFRAKIILPNQEFTYAELEGMLRHEMVHFKRKDVLIKWFFVLTCSIHWFNPVVWFMRRHISRACELSCDEAVIARLDAAGKQTYGDTLILVAADQHRRRPTLAMGEDRRELKERLEAIMRRKRQTLTAVVILLILITVSVAVVIIWGSGSRASLNDDETTPVSTEQNQPETQENLQPDANEPDSEDTSMTQSVDNSQTPDTITQTDEPDDTLPLTKEFSVWREGMEEVMVANLAISTNGYGIYVLPGFEFTEEGTVGRIAPTADSAMLTTIYLTIESVNADDPTPANVEEGSLRTQYQKVELGENSLLISMNYPFEAAEGGAALLEYMAESIVFIN
ncbi:MAG: M56 family metallopeptidase [Lachnospiraceae bacterium]|jgi:beta-lactamase regulating signal transducer with metallopeptidase domain|nr:M56 family metallopeptidase [Lachnospiraceae bacterium]